MEIVWENKAKRELKKVYEYILKGSYQNAIKVRSEIIDAVLSLLEHSEKYPPAKYKTNNDGSWRPSNFIATEYHTKLLQTKFALLGSGIQADRRNPIKVLPSGNIQKG